MDRSINICVLLYWKKYLRLNGFMQKKGKIQNSGFYVALFHRILRLYFANHLKVNPSLHERQLYLHGNQFNNYCHDDKARKMAHNRDALILELPNHEKFRVWDFPVAIDIYVIQTLLCLSLSRKDSIWVLSKSKSLSIIKSTWRSLC